MLPTRATKYIPKDLRELSKYNPPAEYDVPSNERNINGCQVFEAFFSENATLLPGVDGGEFFRAIRNGLLHQAQTKNGWTINTQQSQLCDSAQKMIDRDRFAQALFDAFKKYLSDLQQSNWTADIWQKAARKIWWLVQLSR